jgi:hypothetical protein
VVLSFCLMIFILFTLNGMRRWKISYVWQSG